MRRIQGVATTEGIAPAFLESWVVNGASKEWLQRYYLRCLGFAKDALVAV